MTKTKQKQTPAQKTARNLRLRNKRAVKKQARVFAALPAMTDLTAPQDEPVVTPAPVVEVAPTPVVSAPMRPGSRVRNTSPAMKLGAEVVRYLRLHDKKPYGKRGEQALVEMARKAARVANVELGATDAAR